MEPKIAVNMEAFEDGGLLFEGEGERTSQYWARDHFGLHLVWYLVPRDLPVGQSLTAVITVAGDLTTFLANYPDGTKEVIKYNMKGYAPEEMVVDEEALKNIKKETLKSIKTITLDTLL